MWRPFCFVTKFWVATSASMDHSLSKGCSEWLRFLHGNLEMAEWRQLRSFSCTSSRTGAHQNRWRCWNRVEGGRTGCTLLSFASMSWASRLFRPFLLVDFWPLQRQAAPTAAFNSPFDLADNVVLTNPRRLGRVPPFSATASVWGQNRLSRHWNMQVTLCTWQHVPTTFHLHSVNIILIEDNSFA